MTAINMVRFYRNGATDFVLVKAVGRGAAVGYNKRLESWEPASVAFNDHGEASGVYYDMYDDVYHKPVNNRSAMHYIKSVWLANTGASSADLTIQVDAALRGAGYDRGNGKPIA